ncbi:metallophosphoesterase [Hasllibacter sp. MH4015]|uniref:metallophosphoesterase n=1 Tax=Hasllibacter sp. MH4015 TaxID=2854029 RepID=UPI001CD79EC8|nr:metallophosphoesterase [Hasllibacter sp. MH4015]
MTPWQPPAPSERVYIVGDIHGCVGQLGRLLDAIDGDISKAGGAPGRVVFVGDYIDRGKDSADVLIFAGQILRDYPDVLVGLMGNHERMLLDFLDDPAGPAKRWLRYGGLQTMASFGVGAGLSADTKSMGALLDAAGDLRDAMGPELVTWLEHLPKSWNSGTLWVVHAGADPDAPMDRQADKALMWGHDAFLKQERTDGQWVAFGHQPFEEPFAEAGRIAVDTGAVYGGTLTAARVDPDGMVSFLSV